MARRFKTEETMIQQMEVPSLRRSSSLIVIRGEDIGFRIPLSHYPVNIGRSEQSEVCLHDSSVSRLHCQLWEKNNKVYIRDLGATNTTRVNQKKIAVSELNDGDLISVGQIVLKYLGPDSFESEYHETLYQLATQDSLCGMPNRRYFMEQLEREVHRSMRHSNPLCLIMLDIDHFKKVNDTFGHAAGDSVLLAVSECIRNSIRDDDLCARIGGEEFVVLLPETQALAASECAARLLKGVKEVDVSYKEKLLKVTISIGMVSWNPSYKSADSFLQAADAFLYQAKGDGRNCLRGN